MSQNEVSTHLISMKDFNVESEDPNMISYVVPDHLTNTANGFFLYFSDVGLVKITSMKSNMSKSLYENYFEKLLLATENWKQMGVTIVHEMPNQSSYLYHDDLSYFGVSGGPTGKDNLYSAEISFTERKFHERKYPNLKN